MSNDNFEVSQSNGGTFTRVTLNSTTERAAPTEPAPTSRVHGGVTRFDFGTAEAESTGIARYTHTTAGTPGGGVLASLDRQGRNMTVELQPGNPASRTDVATAIREGVLIRDAQGNLQEAPDAKQVIEALQPAPAEEKPQGDPGAEVFNQEHDQIWSEAIAPLPQSAYDAAVASGIAATIGTGDTDQTIRALAGNAGISVEEAEEFVEAGIGMYTRAVEKALQPLGIEGDRLQDAFAYMREQAPGKLAEALGKLVHARDVSGFKELAKDFAIQRPDQGQLATFKAAGFETRIDRDTGEIMARRGQGGWHSAASLMKAARAPAPAARPAQAPTSAPKAAERMVIDPITGDVITASLYARYMEF
jgi:hypothetical protein